MTAKIKADPQPYKVGENRYCLPDTRPGVEGGLYFSFPVISTITGKRIPSILHWEENARELVLENGVWYWVDFACRHSDRADEGCEAAKRILEETK